jgi:heme A synthase
LSKDASAGVPTLIAGVAAVLIGTVEFSLREHRSGYRSHSILLALLPTVVIYTGTLLLLAAFISPVPVALKLAPLALALPVFAVLFKLLRARFQDARRERVFAGSR